MADFVFNDEDLETVLKLESSTSKDEGWSFSSKSEFTEVWKKRCEHEMTHLIKGYLHLPGITPDDTYKLIHDLGLRKRWEKHFPVIDVLEEHPTYRLVYWLVHMPPGVQNRDLVQYVSEKKDEKTNTTYILYHNAPGKVEPKHGVVRASTILSSTIIRPDPQDPNSTRVTILLQNDLGGWIPHDVVNFFAAKSPGEWRDNLYHFYVNVYSKEKVSETTN